MTRPPPPQDCTKNAETLLVCEFCLKYMKTRRALEKHLQQCAMYHPPGAFPPVTCQTGRGAPTLKSNAART